MKKLFLSLFLLTFNVCLPMAGPAADAYAENTEVPSTLNAHLPNAREINPRNILFLMKSLSNHILKQHQKAYRERQSITVTFEEVKQFILKDTYIQRFKEKDALASLLACLYTMKNNGFIGFDVSSLLPRSCSCIPEEYRITQAFFTVLLIKENYDNKKDPYASLNYVSIASGSLGQDYITLSALIKLGVPHMQITLIDPEYKFLFESDLIYLSNKNQSTTREAREKSALYKHQDRMEGYVSYFKFLIQEVIEHYQKENPFAQHSGLSIVSYKSTDEYLNTIAQNPLAQPDILVLSDSADMPKIRESIWNDFEKIRALTNKTDSIISVLDHDEKDELFITILKDGQKIVALKGQNLIKPAVAPKPKVKPPVAPKPRPSIAPKPQLQQSTRTGSYKHHSKETDMEEVANMIDNGIISLEDAIKTFFTNPAQEMKFKFFYKAKRKN